MGGLPVRDRGAFKDKAVYGTTRMSKLPEQAGLTYPSFADKGRHLTVTRSSSLQRMAERLKFSAPPHKASEPAGCSLQPRTHRTSAGDLIDFNGLGQTLHIDQPKRLHLHIAFCQF